MFNDEDSAFDLEETIEISLKESVRKYNYIETDDESYLNHSINDSPICSRFFQKSSLLGLLKPIETIFN